MSAKNLRRSLAVVLATMFACIMAMAQYDQDQGQYQIISARYGTERHNVDVTRQLQQLASDDTAFRMGNSTFGVDPDPGVVKTLRIYARGPRGHVRMFEYREGSTVDGSMFTGWSNSDWGNRGNWSGGWNDYDRGEYRILQARYGTERNNVDVTARLKELAREATTFRMGNSTFGFDPDPGAVKMLRIFARGQNGEMKKFEYREGSVVNGAIFSSWGGGDWGGGNWNGGWNGNGEGNGNAGSNGSDSGNYRIVHARYGTPQHNVDVTDRLRQIAQEDVTFRMGNSTFGVDPDPGVVKMLRIFTRDRDGHLRTFEYREGSTIDGSQFTGWRGGNWGNERWNGGWGGGWEGGRDHDRDGDRDRGGDRWNRGDGQRTEGNLQIVRATYGSGRLTRDVTERLRSMISNGRIDLTVNNDSMGGDPAPGQRKTLSVFYSSDLRKGQRQANVGEGGRLSLP